MPHVTEHTPKVSTRLVNPYSRESSREKRQQDRQTDRPKPLFSTFWGSYIPNPVLSRSRFFARCQYFHWHGSKIGESHYYPRKTAVCESFIRLSENEVGCFNFLGRSIRVIVWSSNETTRIRTAQNVGPLFSLFKSIIHQVLYTGGLRKVQWLASIILVKIWHSIRTWKPFTKNRFISSNCRVWYLVDASRS